MISEVLSDLTFRNSHSIGFSNCSIKRPIKGKRSWVLQPIRKRELWKNVDLTGIRLPVSSLPRVGNHCNAKGPDWWFIGHLPLGRHCSGLLIYVPHYRVHAVDVFHHHNHYITPIHPYPEESNFFRSHLKCHFISEALPDHSALFSIPVLGLLFPVISLHCTDHRYDLYN